MAAITGYAGAAETYVETGTVTFYDGSTVLGTVTSLSRIVLTGARGIVSTLFVELNRFNWRLNLSERARWQANREPAHRLPT
jgi:hypothetical protein